MGHSKVPNHNVCSSHGALQTSALAINSHKVRSGVHTRRDGVLTTLLILAHLNRLETIEFHCVHNLRLQYAVDNVSSLLALLMV